MSAEAMSDSMVAAWASASALLGPITRASMPTPCWSETSPAAAAHPCSNDADLVAPVALSDSTKFNGSPASSLAAIRSASTKLPHASSATWGGPSGSSHNGLLDDRLLDGLLHVWLPDRLLFAGGRLVDSFVLGGLPFGIRRKTPVPAAS